MLNKHAKSLQILMLKNQFMFVIFADLLSYMSVIPTLRLDWIHSSLCILYSNIKKYFANFPSNAF